MNEQSRRQFMQACFYWTLSGLTFSSFPLVSGCRKGEKKGPLTEHEKNAPLIPSKTAKIDPAFIPAYLKLHKTGELKKRGEALWTMMESCNLCPRMCGINRLEGNEGFCKASSTLEISSHHPHFGEEDPLVGKGGSGTIFFTNCGLRCVFCINWEISLEGQGSARGIEDLAGMMIDLQERGCHNIKMLFVFNPILYLSSFGRENFIAI